MVVNDRDDKIYDPIPGKAFTPNKPILPTEWKSPAERDEELGYNMFKLIIKHGYLAKFIRRMAKETGDPNCCMGI